MDNYPPGSDNQFAPWNQKCTDAAEGHAIRQVTGDDAVLTGMTLAAFFEDMSDERTALVSHEGRAMLFAPISNAELFKTMHRGEQAYCYAATKELIARYLADEFTRQNINGRVEVLA